VQRSLRADFGNLIDPEAGERLAVLSSGHAADATDTNPSYAPFQGGQDLGPEDVRRGLGGHAAEKGRAEKDAGDHFSDHRGLAQPAVVRRMPRRVRRRSVHSQCYPMAASLRQAAARRTRAVRLVCRIRSLARGAS
jgi:hypothetical protein